MFRRPACKDQGVSTQPAGQHEVALAFIARQAEVLLAHRHPQRVWYPDCWDLPGGHIEKGESPQQAVRRECREELGIEVASLEPWAVRLSDPGIRAHGFHIIEWSGQLQNLAPTEHDQLRWVHARDLESLPLADPALRVVLLNHLARAEVSHSE